MSMRSTEAVMGLQHRPILVRLATPLQRLGRTRDRSELAQFDRGVYGRVYASTDSTSAGFDEYAL